MWNGEANRMSSKTVAEGEKQGAMRKQQVRDGEGSNTTMASAVHGAYRMSKIKYPAPKDIYKIKPRTKPA